MSRSKLEWEDYFTSMIFAEGDEPVFTWFEGLLNRSMGAVQSLENMDFVPVNPYKQYPDGSDMDKVACINALLQVIYANGLCYGRYVDKDVSDTRRMLFHENYKYLSEWLMKKYDKYWADCKGSPPESLSTIMKETDDILKKATKNRIKPKNAKFAF